MKAVILAGGFGTRISEESHLKPKPMIEINGKPVLEHNLEMCRKSGITDIYINLYHLGHKISNYFGDGSKYCVNITYNSEPKLLGTSGALLPFRKHLKREPFFIIYGDNYFDFDLRVLKQFHEEISG